jgi:hypothetical protein
LYMYYYGAQLCYQDLVWCHHGRNYVSISWIQTRIGWFQLLEGYAFFVLFHSMQYSPNREKWTLEVLEDSDIVWCIGYILTSMYTYWTKCCIFQTSTYIPYPSCKTPSIQDVVDWYQYQKPNKPSSITT